MHDDPTEQVQEDIHHHATHGDGHGEEHAQGQGDAHGGGHGGHHGARWITAAALTAALLAALAAISAALSASHLTDSTLIRISANDRWNQYQAKSVKDSLTDVSLTNYAEQLALVGGDVTKLPDAVTKQHKSDLAKKAEYHRKAEEEEDAEDPKGMPGLSALALQDEKDSKDHLDTHETFELSETLFHISIAVVAIAVVAKRKEFWYVSMVGGVIGLGFFGKAMVYAPHEKLEKAKVVATQPGATTEKSDGKKAPEHAAPAGSAPAEHGG